MALVGKIFQPRLQENFMEVLNIQGKGILKTFSSDGAGSVDIIIDGIRTNINLDIYAKYDYLGGNVCNANIGYWKSTEGSVTFNLPFENELIIFAKEGDAKLRTRYACITCILES